MDLPHNGIGFTCEHTKASYFMDLSFLVNNLVPLVQTWDIEDLSSFLSNEIGYFLFPSVYFTVLKGAGYRDKTTLIFESIPILLAIGKDPLAPHIDHIATAVFLLFGIFDIGRQYAPLHFK